MSKQDRTYTRTAAELEQKHGFGKKFSEVLGLIDDTRDKVDSVESSLSDVKGGLVSCERKVSDNEASIKSLTEWQSKDSAALTEYKQEATKTYATQKMLTDYQSGTSETLAEIKETADKDRSAIELLVEYDLEGNPTASGSFIIEAINGESSAKIEADRLDIEGKELNIKVKSTNITGTLTAAQIDATNLKVAAANITGTLTVKEADGDVLFSAGKDDSGESKVQIGSWNVDNNSLWTGTSFSDEDSIFLSTGSNGSLSIAGSPKQSNWVIKAGANYGVNKNGDLWCSSFNLGYASTDELSTYRETRLNKETFLYKRDDSYFKLEEIDGAPIGLHLEALIDPSGAGTSGSNYTQLIMTGEDGFARGVLAGEWYVKLSDGREVNLAEYLENHGG